MIRIGWVVLCCGLMAGSVFASTIVVLFPAAGNAYLSQGESESGTIPAGGQTAYQWTADDYVTSGVFSVPGSSVTGLTENWIVKNFLGGGNTQTWNILINGVVVGSETLPDCDFCNTIVTLTNTLSFAGIVPAAGGYQLSLVLQSTTPSGGGSVAWLDGGTTTLTYDASAIPEPSGLLPLGLMLLAGLSMARGRIRR
jgi:hypothetical protein